MPLVPRPSEDSSGATTNCLVCEPVLRSTALTQWSPASLATRMPRPPRPRARAAPAITAAPTKHFKNRLMHLLRLDCHSSAARAEEATRRLVVQSERAVCRDHEEPGSFA